MSETVMINLVYIPEDAMETENPTFSVKEMQVPLKYTKKWVSINNVIEDTGDASAMPVQASPEVFEKVMEFTKLNLSKVFPVKCMCGKGNADYGHPQDKAPLHCIDCREKHKYKGQGLINFTKETPLTEEENKFCDVGHIMLTDLIKIANLLDYPYLLHVTCKYLAGIIEKGQIKQYCGITRKFTQKDYDRVEKENPWMKENLKVTV